ncbi:MAG: ABC-2 transporter permease [Pseudomonadota bacterium]
MNVNTTLTLVQRELLEHRSIFIAPAILTGIILIASLFGVFKGIGASAQVAELLSELDYADPQRVNTVLRGLLSAVFASFMVPFYLLMSAVTGFYLLDSLYGERKDRSILFWRSLPVSDAQTVLSKLLTGLFAIGFVAVAAVVIAFFLNGIVLSFGLLVLGKNPLTFLWLPAPWISGPLFLLYAVLANALWYSPFAAWLLLVSSASRGAPLLWAAGIPAGLMYLEQLLFRTQYLWETISGHVVGFVLNAFHEEDDFSFDSDDFGAMFDEAGPEVSTSLLSLPNPVGLVTSIELWIGLLVAAALTFGAMRMRRYQDV